MAQWTHPLTGSAHETIDYTWRRDPRASWAAAKVDRATQHIRDVEHRLNSWPSAIDNPCVSSMVEDRCGYTVKVRDDIELPPLEEWSLILGDAFHNLRSALDAFVWGCVDNRRLTEREERQIAFPIVLDASRWDETADRVLRTVPPEIRDRIKDCQPFNRPETERPGDGLVLLHHLDVLDKHRRTLQAQVVPRSGEYQGALEFLDERDAARNGPPDTTVHDVELRPGALLLTVRTRYPLARAETNLGLTLQFGLDPGLGFLGARELCNGVHQLVNDVLEHVT